MAEVAEIAQDSLAKLSEGTANTLKKILEKLLSLLEYTSNKDKAAKAFAKWIKNGKGIAHYAIQGDCIGEMKAKMKEMNIPFLTCSDNNSIIVRTSNDIQFNDLAKVQELNHDILLARTNYFQEAEIGDFEDAIAMHAKENQKNVFVIQGLNKYELEVLKNKCNNISKGFTVAHSKSKLNNNLEDACIAAKRVATFRKEVDKENGYTHYKKDVCRATLQAMLSLYGPNEENKKKQIEDDAILDEKVMKLKHSTEVYFIVGQFDNKKYIELSPNGFTFYDYNKPENPIMSRVDTSDINYKGELQAAMDCIYNKILLNSPDKLNKHLSSDEKNMISDRTGRTIEQKNRSRGESDLSIKIDEMIKDRMINAKNNKFVDKNGDLNCSEDKVYKIYCSEAAKNRCLGCLRFRL